MQGRRNQHEWDYMGVSKGNIEGLLKGELGYCRLCKKFRVATSTGYFFIKRKEFQDLKIEGSESW